MAVNNIGAATAPRAFYTQEWTLDTNVGGTWTAQTRPNSNTVTYFHVAYGGGQFVAVGYDSTAGYAAIATSPDGITWTNRPTTTNMTLLGVAYGNGLWVAVGGKSATTTAMTSTDGVTWTPRTMPSSQQWTAVAYLSGASTPRWVAVSGYSSSVSSVSAYSLDGISWTAGTVGGYSGYYGALVPNLAGTTLVAIAGMCKDSASVATYNWCMTTTDGVNWTARTMPTSVAWTGAVATTSGFVAIPGNGYNVSAYATDTTGVTWGTTYLPLPVASAYYTAGIQSGTTTVAVTTRAQVSYSVNNTYTSAWQVSTQTGSNSLWGVAANGSGTVVAVGASTIQTTVANAYTWTAPANVYTVTAFAVGGGGGGGSGMGASTGCGGGGGAGQVIYKPIAVTPGTTYAVNLGVGGQGGMGIASYGYSAAGTATTLGAVLTAAGGGAGGMQQAAGGNGGSGGGAGSVNTSTTTYGTGGGGGAGGPGGLPRPNNAAGAQLAPSQVGGVSTGPGGSSGGWGASTAATALCGDGGIGLYGIGGGGGGGGSYPGVGCDGGGNGGSFTATAGLPNTGGGGGGCVTQYAGGYGGSGYLRLEWWA